MQIKLIPLLFSSTRKWHSAGVDCQNVNEFFALTSPRFPIPKLVISIEKSRFHQCNTVTVLKLEQAKNIKSMKYVSIMTQLPVPINTQASIQINKRSLRSIAAEGDMGH